jgi:tetrapyrrole methylase family protein/MazG family protein
VFGDANVTGTDEVLTTWETIKAKEKAGKADVSEYLGEAFDEAEEMIEAARQRKGLHQL